MINNIEIHIGGTTRPRLAHLDAGLEYLKSIQQPGQRFSRYEIARACGVTHQAIEQREKKILEKIRKRFGIELREYL